MWTEAKPDSFLVILEQNNLKKINSAATIPDRDIFDIIEYE
jgi:hypothetical protein